MIDLLKQMGRYQKSRFVNGRFCVFQIVEEVIWLAFVKRLGLAAQNCCVAWNFDAHFGWLGLTPAHQADKQYQERNRLHLRTPDR